MIYFVSLYQQLRQTVGTEHTEKTENTEKNTAHHPSPHSPHSTSQPPPHLTASPRPSPVGRETKHLKSAVTLKLSPQNSALKIQPSKFNLQNSTFPKPLISPLSSLIYIYQLLIINYQLYGPLYPNTTSANTQNNDNKTQQKIVDTIYN